MAIEGIIGKKVGMTQVFAEDGALVPVTVIQAGPCLIVQKKTADKDGYDAVQIGLVEKISNRRITNANRGHFEKAGLSPLRTLAEFEYSGEANVGDRVQVDIFKPGDAIDVVGQSKGKGFQGVMKRHNFRGGRASHGSMFHRAPGSIGASAFPSRVMKGMRMGGRMGGDQVTVKNLRVAKIDLENNLLYIRGAVPGGRNGLVIVRFAKNGKRLSRARSRSTSSRGTSSSSPTWPSTSRSRRPSPRKWPPSAWTGRRFSSTRWRTPTPFSPRATTRSCISSTLRTSTFMTSS